MNAKTPWTPGVIAGTDRGVIPPADGDNLSFIGVEPHEQIKAQSFVDQAMRDATKSKDHPEGFTFRENARLTRYFCVVKIYVRPEELKTFTDAEGKTSTLYLPDMVRAEDRFQSCTGVVIALGPQCFMDKEGKPRGSKYYVGDHILFPRTDIIRVDFHGVALGVMTDDRAIAVIKDPADWTQGLATFKA